MAQTSVLSQVSAKAPTATCAVCPFFKDYNEPRGRGWCQVFNHYAFRHHLCTDTCRSAIQPLLEEQPVTVRVELVSKELDPDEDTPVHLHSLVVEVAVSKPDRQKVKTAIRKRIWLCQHALLGYASEYDIAYHWIPEKFVPSDAI
ncbi:hypothetical protein C7H19_24515 [Aphanothece hegewaldii CCALA 016]|uniref:Uncharacterized protein n=1 Tax=Aphanothece hegewaldii CCALA 016 TaxID=2107694 RepID=A0A2T1LQM8_9CHRO|nr:hypothetical protein [Aphanothece hegewaldii]PSF28942.1 hypothetical protein C7H19_24515 [Aphanothece hegewaldii CCALA 016]